MTANATSVPKVAITRVIDADLLVSGLLIDCVHLMPPVRLVVPGVPLSGLLTDRRYSLRYGRSGRACYGCTVPCSASTHGAADILRARSRERD